MTFPTLLTRLLKANDETPPTAFMKLTGDKPYSFLLESVEGGVNLGRYSMIGAAPDLIWRCEKGQVAVNRNALNDLKAFEKIADDPLENLRALIQECQIPGIDPSLPPMTAGLFGYLGFAMMRFMEPKLKDLRSHDKQPDAIMVRPTIMAIFDNVEQTILLISPVWKDNDEMAATARLDAAEQTLKTNLPLHGEGQTAESSLGVGTDTSPPPKFAAQILTPPEMGGVNYLPVTSNTEKNDFLDMVEHAKDYIKAGDIFQVVLSQRFSVPFTGKPFDLYRTLCHLNPSPFLVYMNWGDFHIVASSPEILVRVRDGEVTIRPIAGTRPRGNTPEEDQALAEELLQDEKELAEHLMLVDLGRNDVGRVAKLGSVKVTERMIVEYYSHVMHIVSNVTGALSDNHDALDAVCAGFPAGTVSGAPKIRAVDIINELEKDPRGIYGGCLGYFSASGEVDTCIALRTAVIQDNILDIQAGAGIVADSNPESEYQECVNKSRALIRAAEEMSG